MAVRSLKGGEFQAALSENAKVLIDFYADWCGPCRMLSPLVEEISKEREDTAFYKVNVDEEGELAAMFGIASIPTLICFKNGEVSGTRLGYCDKEEIGALLDE